VGPLGLELSVFLPIFIEISSISVGTVPHGVPQVRFDIAAAEAELVNAVIAAVGSVPRGTENANEVYFYRIATFSPWPNTLAVVTEIAGMAEMFNMLG